MPPVPIRACAVARVDDIATIGLDAETHDKLPDGVLDVFALEIEQARLVQLAEAVPGVCWDRMLFSAKESVYKGWFPLYRRMFNLRGYTVELALSR